MKLLDDINKIVKLLEPLNFKLIKLKFDNQILECLQIHNEKILIELEIRSFSRSYEFKICENVEYTYDRNDIEKHLDIRRDPRFKYLGTRSIISTDTDADYGYIIYDSITLHLGPSQTEPDLKTITGIIKKTFNAELREMKLKELGI